MKVQTKITAPCDGIVAELPAAGRQEVAAGAVLAVIAEAADA
jgi:biotin carboxyl carrier protein